MTHASCMAFIGTWHTDLGTPAKSLQGQSTVHGWWSGQHIYSWHSAAPSLMPRVGHRRGGERRTHTRSLSSWTVTTVRDDFGEKIPKNSAYGNGFTKNEHVVIISARLCAAPAHPRGRSCCSGESAPNHQRRQRGQPCRERRRALQLHLRPQQQRWRAPHLNSLLRRLVAQCLPPSPLQRTSASPLWRSRQRSWSESRCGMGTCR